MRNSAHILIVQELYRAVARGDVDAVVSACAPDVDWQLVGRREDFPTFGQWKGPAEVERFFRLVLKRNDFRDLSARDAVCGRGRLRQERVLVRPFVPVDENHRWRPTWLRSNPPRNLCPGATLRTNYLATAGDYHNTLAVDPANADVVYGGGICVVVSTGGGAPGSWSSIGEGTTDGPHRDHHALAFDASNPPRLLDGNDGGIWRLRDPSGPTWDNLNANLQITQFVGIALHPTDPNTAYGGTQDTGVMKFSGDVRWVRQLRGDGGAFAVNPLNPNRVYAISRFGCSDGNYFKRSNNGGDPLPDGTGTWVTQVSGIDPFSTDPCDPPLNFYPALVLEPANATPARDRLLLGTNRVFETVNGAGIWNAISMPGTAGWTGKILTCMLPAL